MKFFKRANIRWALQDFIQWFFVSAFALMILSFLSVLGIAFFAYAILNPIFFVIGGVLAGIAGLIGWLVV